MVDSNTRTPFDDSSGVVTIVHPALQCGEGARDGSSAVTADCYRILNGPMAEHLLTATQLATSLAWEPVKGQVRHGWVNVTRLDAPLFTNQSSDSSELDRSKLGQIRAQTARPAMAKMAKMAKRQEGSGGLGDEACEGLGSREQNGRCGGHEVGCRVGMKHATDNKRRSEELRTSKRKQADASFWVEETEEVEKVEAMEPWKEKGTRGVCSSPASKSPFPVLCPISDDGLCGRSALVRGVSTLS